MVSSCVLALPGQCGTRGSADGTIVRSQRDSETVKMFTLPFFDNGKLHQTWSISITTPTVIGRYFLTMLPRYLLLK